jgi:hypothetical protein
MPTVGYEVVQLGGEVGDEEQALEGVFRAGRSWLKATVAEGGGMWREVTSVRSRWGR